MDLVKIENNGHSIQRERNASGQQGITAITADSTTLRQAQGRSISNAATNHGRGRWRTNLKMILTEKNIDAQKITQLIGQSIRQDWTKPKNIGGPRLFLKRFVNKSDGIETLKRDSKCNFEKKIEGLLLHTNYSNKRTLVPLPFTDISELKITRGKEEIRTFFPYPMWILLKLGVSILYARYFRFRPWEYSIEPFEFKLTSRDYDFEFIGNGFDFERKLSFLKNLGLEEILKTKIKANT